MALLASQKVVRTGLAPAYAAANAGGDTFTPGQGVFLEAKNASGAAITVTIVTPGSTSGQAIADVAVSVPATTGERKIGPLPGSLFADPATGVGNITYSGVTSLTVAIVDVSES